MPSLLRQTRDEARPVVLVTTSWDDGYPLDLRLADLLDRFGIEATFYVPVRSQMPVLGARQVRELAQRFDIGGHTVNHVLLTTVAGHTGAEEIRESKRRLEDITGKPCRMFCPPGGRFGRRHIADIREAGYCGVRTVELMSLDYPESRDGLVILPTTLQIYPHGAPAYFRNALKRGRWKNLKNYFELAHGGDLTETFESLLSKLMHRGGMLHIWGHSWELEHSRLWGTLTTILKHLDAYRDRCRFVSNSALCEQIRLASREQPAVCEQATLMSR